MIVVTSGYVVAIRKSDSSYANIILQIVDWDADTRLERWMIVVTEGKL